MTRLLEKWAVDPPLVFAIFAMTLFGIAMIYSAGVVHIPNAVTQDAWVKQAAWFAIALVAFTVLARVPLRWIEWVAVPAYVVGVLLLAIRLVIGIQPRSPAIRIVSDEGVEAATPMGG